jgi:DNA-binding NarL/FixJ family response regulator
VAAACELGISDTTARQHLSSLYRRTGCLNVAQAAYWLGKGDLERSGVIRSGGHPGRG